MTKKRRLILVFIILFLPPPSFAEGDEARKTDTITVYLENDLFGFDNHDRYYTHGTKISWVSRDLTEYRDMVRGPAWLLRLMERLPFVNNAGDVRTVSFSLGQNIYTPENKQRTDLIPDDRPYAGITYLGFGFHSRNRNRMDTLELDLGIVGRHSYAEDCQKEIHKWTDSPEPMGWAHQLDDEPVLNVYYERRWRTLQAGNADGLGFDFIPHAGVAAGNVYTGANVGGQVRFGWHVPSDFGTYLIRPGSGGNAPVDDADPRFSRSSRRFGVHLFFAVDGNAVARNIFLDGNTFRDSHSVDKKPFVADIIGGVGIIIHRFKITYSYVHRTKEFDTQREAQNFGAVSVSFTF